MFYISFTSTTSLDLKVAVGLKIIWGDGNNILCDIALKQL
jgi:hypothetical protein